MECLNVMKKCLLKCPARLSISFQKSSVLLSESNIEKLGAIQAIIEFLVK